MRTINIAGPIDSFRIYENTSTEECRVVRVTGNEEHKMGHFGNLIEAMKCVGAFL